MLVGGLVVLIIAMALLAKGNSIAASRPQAAESKSMFPRHRCAGLKQPGEQSSQLGRMPLSRGHFSVSEI
jgi:hypothetical protein